MILSKKEKKWNVCKKIGYLYLITIMVDTASDESQIVFYWKFVDLFLITIGNNLHAKQQFET